jgi:hypothetical protein
MAAAGWVNRRAHIDGLPEVSDDACYRAMDWLFEIAPELEKEVFWQVATLLDSEVDLLFFDTTSTYFEIEEPDQPVVHDDHGRRLPDHPADKGTDSAGGDGEVSAEVSAGRGGFRTHGKSKDSVTTCPRS